MMEEIHKIEGVFAMRMFLPAFNYVCMLILSVITATFVYTMLFAPPESRFSYVEVTSLFILIAYVLFATPISKWFYTVILRSFDAVIYWFILSGRGWFVRRSHYGLIMVLSSLLATKFIYLAFARPLFIGYLIPPF